MTMMPNIDPQLLRMIATAMGQSLPADRMDSFPPVGYQRQPQLMSPLGLPDVDQYGLTSDPMYGVGDQPMRAEVPLAPGDLASLAKLLQTLGRSHPKYIAAKKWFHGGAEGMESQAIDPFYGRHESKFGHGFYMSDEPLEAREYARSAMHRGKTPTTYEAELSVDRVLDLEKPIPDEVAEIFRNRAKWVYDEGEGIVSEAVERALAKEGATGESVFRAFKSGISDASREAGISAAEYADDFQELAIALREAGYDALTHTEKPAIKWVMPSKGEPVREFVNKNKKPHQVMIMLDPHDAYSQVGRGDQIRRFKPTAHE